MNMFNFNQKIKKITSVVTVFAFMVSLLPWQVQPLNAALVPGGTVGPIIVSDIGRSLPAWYMDQNGLALEIMEASDGFGVSAPVELGNNFSAELGFADEGFYWTSDAILNNPHGVGIAVLALESAFLDGTVDGGGSAFGRIRFRFDVGEPGTYTIRHPFGTNTYNITAVGPGPEINDTSDIGCFPTPGTVSCDPNIPAGNPNNYSLALNSGIGPFLTWDTFNLNPTLSDPSLINPANPSKRYIGNPAIEHAVKGSPVGQNFVRVQGPNIGGPGIDFIQNNLFSVSGRIAVIDTTAPTIGATNPPVIPLNSQNTALRVNLADDFSIRSATIDLGPLGNSLNATLSASQEVPPISSSASGSGLFTIDTTANTLSYNINFSGLPAGDIETSPHIHNASTGINGPAVFDLPLGQTKIGVWNYPKNLEAEILNGNTYVQIHSALFPTGAIRGQILPTANIQNMILTAGTNTNGTWSILFPNFNKLGAFSLPITATDGSNTASGVFNLKVNVLSSVNVTPIASTVIIGQTEQLTASPLDNITAPYDGANINWSSNDTNVATVDASGLVAGVSSGTAIITATAVAGSVTVTNTAEITVVPPTLISTINLNPGWNLITLPIQPVNQATGQPFNYTAESFGSFAGADVVVRWDAVSQQYVSHVVGLPINDFQITNGMGFFIHVPITASVTISGTELPPVTPVLSPGWNLLGFTSLTSTTAEQFGSSIIGVDSVAKFDSFTQQWSSHVMGFPLNDFSISQGEGVFVHRQ